jgi:hypothetical protein
MRQLYFLEGQKHLCNCIMRGGRVKSRAAAGLIHRVRQAENCKLASICAVLGLASISARAASVSRMYVCSRTLIAANVIRLMRASDSRARSLRLQPVCVSGAIKLAHIWRDAGSKIVSPGHLTLSQLEHAGDYLTCAEIATGRGARKVYKCLSQIFIRFFLVLSSLTICAYTPALMGFSCDLARSPPKIHTLLCM